MVAPRNWTYLSMDWTLPDWVVRHAARTQNLLESAVGRGITSAKGKNLIKMWKFDLRNKRSISQPLLRHGASHSKDKLDLLHTLASNDCSSPAGR